LTQQHPRRPLPGVAAAWPAATTAACAKRLRAAVRPLKSVVALRAQRDRLAVQRDELRAKLVAVRADNANLRELRREDRERMAELIAENRRLRGEGAGGAVVPAPEGPDTLRYVFIVTYGRSGSTLLQGILCSQPGFLIRGENGGVLEQLFRFHRRAEAERAKHEGDLPTSPRNPWHGIDGYPPDLALAHMRALVRDTLLRPAADTRVVGFKEIRWPDKELPAFLDFVTALFPNAVFVVNTRNLDDVANSAWWAGQKNVRAKLQGVEDRMLAATTALGERAYRVHYDDYVADPSRLKGLFAWLGEDFDPERVRVVMGRRHSYAPSRTEETVA
jgi:hypothetical protein